MFVGSLYVCFMYRYLGHLLNERFFLFFFLPSLRFDEVL